jgi:hypothetical protein
LLAIFTFRVGRECQVIYIFLKSATFSEVKPPLLSHPHSNRSTLHRLLGHEHRHHVSAPSQMRTSRKVVSRPDGMGQYLTVMRMSLSTHLRRECGRQGKWVWTLSSGPKYFPRQRQRHFLVVGWCGRVLWICCHMMRIHFLATVCRPVDAYYSIISFRNMSNMLSFPSCEDQLPNYGISPLLSSEYVNCFVTTASIVFP